MASNTSRLIAQLGPAGELVGTKRIRREPRKGEVELCAGFDLPVDGTYWYDRRACAFFPMRHPRMVKPVEAEETARRPLNDFEVLCEIARSVPRPSPRLQEWLDWLDREQG